MRQFIGFVVATVLLSSVACRQAAESPKKMAITTTSAESRAAFLKGRDLAEKLRSIEAQPLLDEAIRIDPNFAMAHLLRAQTATSTREFFDHLKAAVAAAGKASDGEQLLIRAEEARGNGDTKVSGDYLTKLVAAYPGDERAHGLLGTHYWTVQQYDAAVSELQTAVQLAPEYAPAYNMLGYALRETKKDKDAETAFRKYIELIPNEPNPHDSLAELLLKMGRFNESIESYQKALSLDARFPSAYRGIAANLMYQEKHKEALAQLQKALDLAREDGERRAALNAMAICYADEGRLPAALESISKASALAEKSGDKAAMFEDAATRGDLLLNAGRIEDARAEYAKSLQLDQESNLPDSAKKNFGLSNHGHLALLASAKKDFGNAKKEAEVMRAGFEALGNPNALRAAHEVLGIIALRQANYDDAISNLTQADPQSPYVLFQLARAYAGKKDAGKAKNCYERTAHYYGLPTVQYAMVRRAALKALGK